MVQMIQLELSISSKLPKKKHERLQQSLQLIKESQISL